MTYVTQLIYGLIAALGFGMMFNAPFKKLIPSCIFGGIGWMSCYIMINNYAIDSIIATFIATLLIGLLCEISARVYKEAAIIFIIPAILPLVPGSAMYLMMLNLVTQHFDLFASYATKSILLALAVAFAIYLTTAVSALLKHINPKLFGNY